MQSYFGKPGQRYYRYRGKKGFNDKPMGRGTPPGALLAPKAFALFQSSDVEMTLNQTVDAWFWPNLFSDDKGPFGRWSALVDWRIQRALNSTWKWSKEQGVKYHITGKKKPVCFVILPAPRGL